MYMSLANRSAGAYRRIGAETIVDQASPHHLVVLLFNELQSALTRARLAMESGDVAAKAKNINHAVRILEEGLKAPLDLEKGGEIARNLFALYEYSANRLVVANARNDLSGLQEVVDLIVPIADGWKQIGGAGHGANAA